MESSCAIGQISPAELKSRLNNGDQLAILDVWEPHELQICSLANTVHIPLGQLPQRLSELADWKDGEIVVYCRSGGRSQRAASFLQTNGFKSVYNLSGGILAWSDQVDPTVCKY